MTDKKDDKSKQPEKKETTKLSSTTPPKPDQDAVSTGTQKGKVSEGDDMPTGHPILKPHRIVTDPDEQSDMDEFNALLNKNKPK